MCGLRMVDRRKKNSNSGLRKASCSVEVENNMAQEFYLVKPSYGRCVRPSPFWDCRTLSTARSIGEDFTHDFFQSYAPIQPRTTALGSTLAYHIARHPHPYTRADLSKGFVVHGSPGQVIGSLLLGLR